MSSADTPSSAFMERRTLVVLIGVALMSFSAVITLLAWAPDLARNDQAGAHPYSVSAIGYAGLVELLEMRGDTVSISRVEQTIGQFEFDRGLLVLTPPMFSNGIDYETDFIAEPALIIFPKWFGQTDRRNKRWQSYTDLGSVQGTYSILSSLDENATMERIEPPGRLNTPWGWFDTEFEEKLQLIQSDYLIPVVSLPEGQLLSRIPETSIYLLSDPDLANTFGLSRPGNAELMLVILDDIRFSTDDPIVFDATLHGFVRSRNLLKIVLDIPFVGATLAAVFTMALLGWTALIRFGNPLREDPAFALGKQALTDNTAGLIAMTRRETRMAPGYLALTRKMAAKELGIPKGLSEREISELFEQMSEGSEAQSRWSELASDLSKPAQSRDDLLDKAQRIYRWRKEKSDGIK
ncbi:MAG: hypothetical protein AAF950_02870 [Pseudomonadota bacterium]